MENYLEINKKSWDAKVEFHLQSDFYFVDEFMKGRTSLNSIELELLGDIRDKKYCICNVILGRIPFLYREWARR
jgi:hypothetical protein